MRCVTVQTLFWDISPNLTSRKKQQCTCSLLTFCYLPIKSYMWLFLVCMNDSSPNTLLMMDTGKYKKHISTVICCTLAHCSWLQLLRKLSQTAAFREKPSSQICRVITGLKKPCTVFPNPSSEMSRSWLKMSHGHIHVTITQSYGAVQLPLLAKSLTLRWLMSYIYGAPILDVSRSHTTTQLSR